jgi:hypothetical protein
MQVSILGLDKVQSLDQELVGLSTSSVLDTLLIIWPYEWHPLPPFLV